jgi:membrane protease YdiL (CAAX protease family)
MVMADRPVDPSRRTRLGRRPVLLFIVVTLLVSYGLGIPALTIAGAWVPGINGVAKLYVGRFLVVAGPTCGAIAAVTATSGRAAIGPFLLRRLSPPPDWWALALLPLIGLAAAAIAYAAAGLPLAAFAGAIGRAWPLLLLHLVLQILIVGLGEELGWRGWLLPSLTARVGMARATALTGLIWYLWHFPILLGGAADSFWFALAIGGLSVLFALLLRWAGGSVLASACAHGSINTPLVFLGATVPQADHRLAWSYLAGMLAIAGMAALLGTRRSWGDRAI